MSGELGEWAIVTFSLSVLAWVIFRLTQTIVRMLTGRKGDDDDADA